MIFKHLKKVVINELRTNCKNRVNIYHTYFIDKIHNFFSLNSCLFY